MTNYTTLLVWLFDMGEQGPSVSSLQWAGCSVSLMHWRNDAWVKWRDMPVLMPVVDSVQEPKS